MNTTSILFFMLAYIQANINIVSARAVQDVYELEPDEKECVTRLHLHEAQIKLLNSQEVTTEENVDFNKFIECYWEKLEWQKQNGDIVYENIKEILQELIASEIPEESPAVKLLVKQMMLGAVSDCEANPPPKGNTNGQTAVRVQNCIMRNFNSFLDTDYYHL